MIDSYQNIFTTWKFSFESIGILSISVKSDRILHRIVNLTRRTNTLNFWPQCVSFSEFWLKDFSSWFSFFSQLVASYYFRRSGRILFWFQKMEKCEKNLYRVSGRDTWGHGIHERPWCQWTMRMFHPLGASRHLTDVLCTLTFSDFTKGIPTYYLSMIMTNTGGVPYPIKSAQITWLDA